MPAVRDEGKSFNTGTGLAGKLKYRINTGKNIYPSTALNLFVL